MLLNYAIALIVGFSVAAVIRFIPIYFKRAEARWKNFGKSQAVFFEHATKLIKDERTPEGIVRIVEYFAHHINDPWLMRRIVVQGLMGRWRSNSEHPTEQMRAFSKQVNGLPEPLKSHFMEAMVAGLQANAYASGIAGKLFLNLMFAVPRTRTETATIIAARPSVMEPLRFAA